MISVNADFVLGTILVGLLCAPTACARQAQIQTLTDTRTNQAAEVKPSSTTKDSTSSPELVPVSAPAAPEPKDSAAATQTPAGAVGPSNNADDSRAVIDWLLDKSHR